MDVRKLSWILLGLMFFSSGAAALNCDVEYRAKKVEKKSTWYGTVEKPRFKSGTVSGTGQNKSACQRNALKPITKAGWKITYKKVKSTR